MVAPRVLSLDWDWFVGVDGGRDCACCLDCKIGRESMGMRKPRLRERYQRRDKYTGFQERERYCVQMAQALSRIEVGRFVVANSHGHIMAVLPDKAEVHNVDLHPDDWEECGDCARWTLDKRIKEQHWFYSERDCKTLLKRMRRWRKLDVLFLALSVPHTAAVDDKLFWQFVRDLAKATGKRPRKVGNIEDISGSSASN